MSSQKVADGKGVYYTRIVKAFEDLDSLQPYNTPPSGLFGINVYIGCNGVLVDGKDLDVEYDVPFDDNMEADEAEIVIYNLTDDTINKFVDGKEITIETGYGDDTGIIFKGNVKTKKTAFDGCDKITTIYAVDDSQNSKVVNITFAENTQASTILKRLLDETGLNVGTVSIRRDHTYTSSVTVDGNLDENIKTYSDVCGVSTYINKGKICARYIKDGDNINFNVCADTGLIGTPTSYEEETTSEEYTDTTTGYDVEMLLQHRITTAAIVNITSNTANGAFRVREGKHTYSDGEGITTFKCIGDVSTVTNS